MNKFISAIVHTNAKCKKVEKRGNVLHIYVSVPPLDGRANFQARDVLAKYLKIAKSKVFIKLGNKNKHKVFEIKNLYD